MRSKLPDVVEIDIDVMYNNRFFSNYYLIDMAQSYRSAR